MKAPRTIHDGNYKRPPDPPAPVPYDDNTDRFFQAATGPESFGSGYLEVAGTFVNGGMVLGKVVATGRYAVYNPTATDGRQIPVAILHAEGLAGVDATTRARSVTVILKDAAVKKHRLQWGPGVTTSAHKETAYAAFLAAGIDLNLPGQGITYTP